jgi:hypothetical protein
VQVGAAVAEGGVGVEDVTVTVAVAAVPVPVALVPLTVYAVVFAGITVQVWVTLPAQVPPVQV